MEISHSEFKEMEEEAPQPLDKEKFCMKTAQGTLDG